VVVAGGFIPPQDYDFLLKETKSCSLVVWEHVSLTVPRLRWILSIVVDSFKIHVQNWVWKVASSQTFPGLLAKLRNFNFHPKIITAALIVS
jgi:hypothetical protein